MCHLAINPMAALGGCNVGIMSDSDSSSAEDPQDSQNAQSTTIDAALGIHDQQTAQIVAGIELLRKSIDNVDTAIVSLLAERFKYTSQVGVLKAKAGFAPADYQREERQIERLRQVATEAGLDSEIAEMYREFVVNEAKKRHRRIAEAGGDPGVLDVFA